MVGRTGLCWDDAMAESFFSAIKNESLHHHPGQGESQVIRYIEGFYNRRRLHSAPACRPPLEVLDEALSTPAAA
ncbi:hypothetical protein [Nonomuraea fuscirosea]|uniref:hypothetical protein n=1 Tax=Nonomuraea fuscirosea TaxID=1291556 RepID=UPI0033D81AFA